MLKKIDTKKAPAAIGPYSQAIVCGNMLFTSGQIPIDPATVSYTHLDVYKRQPFFVTMPYNEAEQKVAIKLSTHQGQETVSYTHLDVYKRQL